MDYPITLKLNRRMFELLEHRLVVDDAIAEALYPEVTATDYTAVRAVCERLLAEWNATERRGEGVLSVTNDLDAQVLRDAAEGSTWFSCHWDAWSDYERRGHTQIADELETRLRQALQIVDQPREPRFGIPRA